MNNFYEQVRKINSKYNIVQKIKAHFNAINVSIRKLALNLLPDESRMLQSAFLLLAAECENSDPEPFIDKIVALELLKTGYEIRDKLVNKTPTFSTHFYVKDKLDMNYGFLISDMLISRALSHLYNNSERRLINLIDVMVNDIVNSRLDVAYLLKSESLDLKKYTEIIIRCFSSIMKIGFLSIKPAAVINPQLHNSASNLATNLAVACEFAEDFAGFLKAPFANNGDMSYVLIENTNLVFPILLLSEIASSYESQMLKNVLTTMKHKGAAPSNKEIWRMKTLVKKYNVNDFALKKINDHIVSALMELKILNWQQPDKLDRHINMLLKSNWDVEYLGQ
ncbi:MAG: hypothetical protein BWY32_03613 [bacterium ADurb.Bin243]|nr:MAG: hypothetical protein BWY32_03613 [bacterium ADurb.Bin243]